MTEEEKVAADKKAADEKAARSRQSGNRSPLEKKIVTAKRLIKEIKDETGETIEISNDDEDDNKPLTRGDLKRMEREKSAQTALELAEQIEDEDERALVIDELENTILPSGNPQKDLAKARALAQSEKNAQIAAEAQRKRNAQSRGSGSGAPPKEEDHFEATPLELRAAVMVGKKSPKDIKDFILKARARAPKRQ